MTKQTVGMLYGLLLCLGSFACGGQAQIVAITFPGDPNVGDQYVCERQPADTKDKATFFCESRTDLFASDRIVDLGKSEKCKNHVQKLWIETNRSGEVVRVQYQCALDEVGGLP